MTVVNHTLLDTEDNPIVNAYVEVRLLAPTELDGAFNGDGAQYISRVVSRTNASGHFSFDLVPTSSITPSGTVYQAIFRVHGFPTTSLFFTVPSSGPVNLADHLTTAPSDISPSGGTGTGFTFITTDGVSPSGSDGDTWLSVVQGAGGFHPWQASSAFNVDDIVQPTTPNGHAYKVTVAGTTGDSEPSFPTDGSTVVDGGVTWLDFDTTDDFSPPLPNATIYYHSNGAWRQIFSGAWSGGDIGLDGTLMANTGTVVISGTDANASVVTSFELDPGTVQITQKTTEGDRIVRLRVDSFDGISLEDGTRVLAEALDGQFKILGVRAMPSFPLLTPSWDQGDSATQWVNVTQNGTPIGASGSYAKGVATLIDEEGPTWMIDLWGKVSLAEDGPGVGDIVIDLAPLLQMLPHTCDSIRGLGDEPLGHAAGTLGGASVPYLHFVLRTDTGTAFELVDLTGAVRDEKILSGDVVDFQFAGVVFRD